MARPLRLELAGGLYHVTARGDRRGAIYFDEEDRLVWFSVLDQVCDRFNWRCHAYCQMTNHYHVVVETPDSNLARGMRQLNGVYTQYVNRRYQRVGHLFQGRYKGILVEKDAYLLDLSRYVVLNPVRAGMVADASAWPWSNYRAIVGKQPSPRWLETDWLLGQFGSDRGRAQSAYADFVRAGVGQEPIWSDLKSQMFLGGEAFVERMQQQIPDKDLREVPRLQRRAPPRRLSDYACGSDRASQRAAMAAAYGDGHYSMQQIADHFGVHYSTVSRAVRSLT